MTDFIVSHINYLMNDQVLFYCAIAE